MRIVLLSDIHGNSIALDAVLSDVQQNGSADAYWILGDLVALGHDPIGVLERLSTLPNSKIIRGNTDRYTVTGDRPPPTVDDVSHNYELLPVFSEIAGTFAWTQGAVTATGWLKWLVDLPLEFRDELPDGTRFLGVHASPGTDDGKGISPELSEDELRMMTADCAADLICVGHTHWPLDKSVNHQRIVNIGSVSNPLAPDLRASYVVIDATRSGYALQFRRVDYDHNAVISALKNLRHPGADFIINHMLGRYAPRWQNEA